MCRLNLIPTFRWHLQMKVCPFVRSKNWFNTFYRWSSDRWHWCWSPLVRLLVVVPSWFIMTPDNKQNEQIRGSQRWSPVWRPQVCWSCQNVWGERSNHPPPWPSDRFSHFVSQNASEWTGKTPPEDGDRVCVNWGFLVDLHWWNRMK